MHLPRCRFVCLSNINIASSIWSAGRGQTGGREEWRRVSLISGCAKWAKQKRAWTAGVSVRDGQRDGGERRPKSRRRAGRRAGKEPSENRPERKNGPKRNTINYSEFDWSAAMICNNSPAFQINTAQEIFLKIIWSDLNEKLQAHRRHSVRTEPAHRRPNVGTSWQSAQRSPFRLAPIPLLEIVKTIPGFVNQESGNRTTGTASPLHMRNYETHTNMIEMFQRLVLVYQLESKYSPFRTSWSNSERPPASSVRPGRRRRSSWGERKAVSRTPFTRLHFAVEPF